MSQSPTARTGDTLARIDAELDRLGKAADVIAANLVELDADPAKTSLDKGPLTATTKAAWADATAALAQLWDGYATLTDLLAKARTLRAQRRLSTKEEADLAEMVFGSSITLSTTTVPLAQRSLLGPGQTTTTCTPAQLLAAMEAAFTVARTTVVEAGDIWTRLLAATAATATALDTTREQARAAHADLTAITNADRRLRAFMTALASDPLGCNDADLAAIDAAIARAAHELTSAAELVATLTRRLADAHTLAERIVRAESAATTAEATAAAKIAPAQVARAGGDRSLAADLAAVDALATAGQWRLLGSRLTTWTTRAQTHLNALEAATAHNTATLAERDELRGRLSSYQAKAARMGRGENPALAELAATAKTILYTAPCDLTAARNAVDAYQSAVAKLTVTDAKDRGQL